MSVYDTLVTRVPIEKGWSGDRKYCAVTADRQRYLLRISAIDRLERKRREYEKMCETARLGIPMCRPIEFGICEEGVYAIHSWIDGVDAERPCLWAIKAPRHLINVGRGAKDVPIGARYRCSVGDFTTRAK